MCIICWFGDWLLYGRNSLYVPAAGSPLCAGPLRCRWHLKTAFLLLHLAPLLSFPPNLGTEALVEVRLRTEKTSYKRSLIVNTTSLNVHAHQCPYNIPWWIWMNIKMQFPQHQDCIHPERFQLWAWMLTMKLTTNFLLDYCFDLSIFEILIKTHNYSVVNVETYHHNRIAIFRVPACHFTKGVKWL